ncbi:hypothetical protein Sjap_013114 [Stephania japonica]|uniref:Uncharacterized protein n=1 Tax=Stephania japonica TaxID=461633 RepID=A0AAP0IZ94_9MAGN
MIRKHTQISHHRYLWPWLRSHKPTLLVPSPLISPIPFELDAPLKLTTSTPTSPISLTPSIISTSIDWGTSQTALLTCFRTA